MSELVSNGVQIYQFPTDDHAVTEINSSMNVSHSLTVFFLTIGIYGFNSCTLFPPFETSSVYRIDGELVEQQIS